MREYLVVWSAPDHRNSGSQSTKEKNKPEAVKKVKAKLGSKVKKFHLHHFDALGPYDKKGRRYHL